MQTDFAKGKGNDQSGKVENEVFVLFFFFFFNFHIVEWQKVNINAVIVEECIGVSLLFGVNGFKGLSPNVVQCSKLDFLIFILMFDAKDPHLSEVNDVSQKVRIFLFYTHN